MGKQSKYFDGETSTDDFLSCHSDFVKKFHEYLENECSKLILDHIDIKIIEIFRKDIYNFYIYLTKILGRSIKNKIDNDMIDLCFLQLNYTNACDELLSRGGIKVSNNSHLHGALNMNPIIGVDNIEQIENDIIKNDVKIQKIFVKQGYLTLLQNRDVNNRIPANNALYAISRTNIFCIFGASIGDTDAYWWQKIGERMGESDTLLIIFDICGKKDNNIDPVAVLESERNYERRRNDIINRFLKLSGLGNNWALDNPNRIIVELDRPIFNFKLPQK